MTTYNVYCDESCHLEHDHISTMALGSVWCEIDKIHEISTRLRTLKREHGFSSKFETKWVKVSPAKLDFYKAVIDFFFDEPQLRFRGVIIPDKAQLDHEEFGQVHDEWYYKMWFVLLKQILSSRARYRIYLDIKDTRSQEKVSKLHEVLRNSLYDFDASIIQRVQQVRSHEAEILQLADLLIGALTYLHRELKTSDAKLALVARIQERSGMTLKHSTLPREEKFNLFVWGPREW